MSNTEKCPCGSGLAFQDCCDRFIHQGMHAKTAEQLMRSRYTAYTLGDVRYLTKTWHPDYCPELSQEELASTQWLRLDVIQAKEGLKAATVEFKAFYADGVHERCLHEVSQFKKIKNHWVYLAAKNF